MLRKLKLDEFRNTRFALMLSKFLLRLREVGRVEFWKILILPFPVSKVIFLMDALLADAPVNIQSNKLLVGATIVTLSTFVFVVVPITSPSQDVQAGFDLIIPLDNLVFADTDWMMRGEVNPLLIVNSLMLFPEAPLTDMALPDSASLIVVLMMLFEPVITKEFCPIPVVLEKMLFSVLVLPDKEIDVEVEVLTVNDVMLLFEPVIVIPVDVPEIDTFVKVLFVSIEIPVVPPFTFTFVINVPGDVVETRSVAPATAADMLLKFKVKLVELVSLIPGWVLVVAVKLLNMLFREEDSSTPSSELEFEAAEMFCQVLLLLEFINNIF